MARKSDLRPFVSCLWYSLHAVCVNFELIESAVSNRFFAKSGVLCEIDALVVVCALKKFQNVEKDGAQIRPAVGADDSIVRVGICQLRLYGNKGITTIFDRP